MSSPVMMEDVRTHIVKAVQTTLRDLKKPEQLQPWDSHMAVTAYWLRLCGGLQENLQNGIQQLVCSAVKEGHISKHRAATELGVAPKTINAWLETCQVRQPRNTMIIQANHYLECADCGATIYPGSAYRRSEPEKHVYVRYCVTCQNQ